MNEISLDVDEQPRNPKKRKGVWIAVFVAIAIICIIITSVIAGDSRDQPTTKEKLSISGTSMSVTYNQLLGYSATISGIAKNVTNRNFSYASVEFSVYDENGHNVGTALANVNNLSAGETWRFEATLLDFPSTRPASYKLVEIISW